MVTHKSLAIKRSPGKSRDVELYAPVSKPLLPFIDLFYHIYP